jgi:hypothetical protein
MSPLSTDERLSVAGVDRHAAREVNMPNKDRKVANETEGEFKRKAFKETFSDSAVDESLDQMAGSSQELAKGGGKVRGKLRRRAKVLSHT